MYFEIDGQRVMVPRILLHVACEHAWRAYTRTCGTCRPAWIAVLAQSEAFGTTLAPWICRTCRRYGVDIPQELMSGKVAQVFRDYGMTWMYEEISKFIREW